MPDNWSMSQDHLQSCIQIHQMMLSQILLDLPGLNNHCLNPVMQKWTTISGSDYMTMSFGPFSMGGCFIY